MDRLNGLGRALLGVTIVALSGWFVWWNLPGPDADSTVRSPSRFQVDDLDLSDGASRDPAYAALFRDADRVANELVARFPSDPPSLYLAGQLRALIGRPSAAFRLWQDVLKLDPQDTEANLAIGMLLFEAGDFSDAEGPLTIAFERSRNPKAAYVLANLLLNQGQLERTEEILKAGLRSAPDSLPHRVLLGQTQLQQQRPLEAKESFLAASRLAPDHANAWFGLATACGMLGEEEEAAQHRATFEKLQRQQLREEIEQSRQQDNLRVKRADLAAAYVAVGAQFLERRDDANAESLWKLAVRTDETNLDARVQLARLHFTQRRSADALEVLAPLGSSDSQDVRYWMQLGEIYTQMEAFEPADKAFIRAIELRPELAEGYTARTELHLRFDRSSDDLPRLAAQAVELQPSAANYFLLSVVKRRGGDLPGARQAAQRAMELEPSDLQYQEWYALMRDER